MHVEFNSFPRDNRTRAICYDSGTYSIDTSQSFENLKFFKESEFYREISKKMKKQQLGEKGGATRVFLIDFDPTLSGRLLVEEEEEGIRSKNFYTTLKDFFRTDEYSEFVDMVFPVVARPEHEFYFGSAVYGHNDNKARMFK